MTADPLCETFLSRARATWDLLVAGRDTGVGPGEETLTDLNLMEIATRHGDRVCLKKFSRWDEARVSGADWEWWLGSPGSWIGLRLQAKKLNIRTLRYDDLAHRNQWGFQVDRLIESSTRDALVPAYCFYNAWDDGSADPSWNCENIPSEMRLFGCTICSVHFVKALIEARSSDLDAVADIWIPWSCIVCCPRGERGMLLVDRVGEQLRQLVRDTSDLPQPRSSLPSYVAERGEAPPGTNAPVSMALMVTDL